MVNASTCVRVNLFLSSYFPLWIILLVMYSIRSPIYQLDLNWSAIVITGALLIVSFYPLWRVRRYINETLTKNSKEKLVVQNTEDMTSEYLLYVVTYVFPFMTAQSFDAYGAVALVGALSIIAILYIRANLFHVNPMLLLFYDYRLYRVVDLRGNTRHVLSKQGSILKNQGLEVSSFHGILFIERDEEPADVKAASSAEFDSK